MKSILFSLSIGLLLLAAWSCNQKEGTLGSSSLKTNVNTLVVVDTQADMAVESSSYESEVLTMGNTSISAYLAGTLKDASTNTESITKSLKPLWEHFPKFKLHFAKGIVPDMTITTTNGGYPKTITINYGDSTLLENGHVLKGVVTIVLTGDPKTVGTSQTITYNSFCTDSICLSGTIVKARTKDPLLKFSENADLTLTYANGYTVHRVETKARLWVAGADTEFDTSDDMVEITGMVLVSDSNGNEYSKTIVSPLVKLGSCKYISKGIIAYKGTSGNLATVDYGDGTCDNLAVRTTSAGSTTITLGK